ncbi:MAG TPA: hypothetical protein IAC67_06810 [Candidatus Coproplasma excrementipullorum]|nr:hypothetical protein [Candidatus Coproplasma excrementipullorum]
MISNYAANKVLQSICGQTQYCNLATSSFLGLSSTQPQANGQGVTEPSGNGYARKQIGQYQNSAGWLMNSPSNGAVTNKEEIHFNEAEGAWGELGYVCIFDAATNGNLLAWGQIGSYSEGGEFTPSTINPTANTVPLIKVGNIKISIT